MTKTYVVTGANRGIGLQLCRALAARGEAVVGTAREPAAATELAGLGVRVEALDVADAGSVARFAAALEGQAVDVLINNSGTGLRAGGLGALDHGQLERTFQVNCFGPLRVTEALLPNLRAGGSKVVAQMTSRMGSIEDNTSGGSYGYRGSKAALNMFNKSLALDLGSEGFRCVVLHPGWVRTDMGGPSAPLSVEDSVAGLVRVLDGLGPADNGAFIDFAGERIPW